MSKLKFMIRNGPLGVEGPEFEKINHAIAVVMDNLRKQIGERYTISVTYNSGGIRRGIALFSMRNTTIPPHELSSAWEIVQTKRIGPPYIYMKKQSSMEFNKLDGVLD